MCKPDRFNLVPGVVKKKWEKHFPFIDLHHCHHQKNRKMLSIALYKLLFSNLSLTDRQTQIHTQKHTYSDVKGGNNVER